MNTELLEKIAEKDFDLDRFVQLAIEDEEARNEIALQMRTNPAIMVYYHCYYVLDKASQQRPELIYPYWAEIAELLHHSNSYHRDFGLEIIANLTKGDRENRFAEIADEFFAILNDEKFMTGHCCLRNLAKIYRHKPDQRGRIIATFLDIDQHCDYTPKQIAVLKADILVLFEEAYREVPRRNEIDDFIRAQVNCLSPKTRKLARRFVRKYAL